MGLFSFLFDHQVPTSGGFMSSDTLPKADPNQPIDPGMSVPQHLTAGASPEINQAMAPSIQGDLGEARTLPHMENHPGLLHNLASYALSPQGMMAIGTALRASGGDQNAWSDAAQMQARQVQMAQFQRQLALQQRGNQAFRAAYVTDPKTGQTRFNPQIYAQVMGDALDPKDMVAMAKTFAPEEALQDGFITRKDPLTGELTLTGQRPMNYGEQTAEQQAAESHRHNTVEEGQGSARIAEDARSHRASEGIAAGNLGVAQQNAGTSAAHLTLDRQTAARNPGPPLVSSEADVARLPPGSPFISPDGVLRIKH